MHQSNSLQVGDKIQLSGGYSFEPEWLISKEFVRGSVIAFMPGQNETPAAVIKIDEPITFESITGNILVLELRYVSASWGSSGTVHVELCDFMPDASPWQNRRQGKWAESHATYNQLAT